MFNALVNIDSFAQNAEQMNASSDSSVLQHQLLLQFGDRLRRLRKSQRLSTVEMASRVGISRTTLSAVEAGDPAPAMGTYLRVMSALGIVGDLALLAGDVMRPATPYTAAARSSRDAPLVRIVVSADTSRHRIQDLQSLVLHEEAVRRVRADPLLLHQAQAVLQTWLDSGDQRSASLWVEWKDILEHGKWRKALGRTRRAQELRQASPMATVLPPAVRKRILREIRDPREGVVLENVGKGQNLTINPKGCTIFNADLSSTISTEQAMALEDAITSLTVLVQRGQ